jgi:arylformamidase
VTLAAPTGRPAADPWIDISAPLDGPIPTWPTSVGVSARRTRDLANGDPVTETLLEMDVHCGTHVDAPAHVLVEGAPVASLPMTAFIGPAVVVDVTGHPAITAELIDAHVPADAQRVLFRTDNSERALMRQPEFAPDFTALDLSGAQALAARADLLLIGMDYLSIQLYGGDDDTHRVLLARGIAALEGLDLTDARPGRYELVAPPLRLDDAEASPVRALIRPLTD